MWLKRLSEWNEKELQKDELERLNFKCELHISKYLVDILKGEIDFRIKQDELQIIKDKKEISKEEFIYWWQIIRYEEISNEQLEIKKKIKEINDKLIKLSKMYPSENVNDDEEMIKKKKEKKEELDKKKDKIIDFMKKDEPNIKKNQSLLNNFKLFFIKKEGIVEMLDNIELYVNYSAKSAKSVKSKKTNDLKKK